MFIIVPWWAPFATLGGILAGIALAIAVGEVVNRIRRKRAVRKARCEAGLERQRREFMRGGPFPRWPR